jgi:4-hydroxybenzoate polyprenyltransferase
MRVTEYAHLMRLDRPVGTWLLLWPALWALWIAGDGRPVPLVLIVFVLGVFVMRAAGCVINDFADRDIDPHIRRTRDRPLAARRVSPLEALVLFAALNLIALYLVTRLDPLTIRLAVIGALLTVSYPFSKRFFPIPQLYLGISFRGFSVLMAYAAQAGVLPRVAWLLFFSAALWAAVYDTIYAMVDREDDLKIGVKSSAILFADMDKFLIGVMQAMMLGALELVGRNMHFGVWYYGGVNAALAFSCGSSGHPQARAGGLPARFPQQPVRRPRHLRGHSAAVRLRPVSCWKNRPFTTRLRCALHGFAHAVSAEQNVRLQLLAFAAALLLLLVLRPAPLWWALVLLSSASVLACELLNTAIERLADALHPSDSEAIGTVKDCAAAAVLIACLGALGVAAALAMQLLRGP